MGAAERDPIAEAWRLAWECPDRRYVGAWGEQYVYLDGDYAKTGWFRIGDSRYLVKPFEFLSNDATRMVNLCKAVRTGGSLVGDVWLQHIFRNDPGPFMATFQTDPDAERHYLTKVEKTFKKTPINAELFSRLKKKLDLYQFPHMNFYFQGANLNSLQGKGIKYEWNSELWSWDPGMPEQAFSRTEDFKRVCKILNDSQGGDVKTDWEIIFNRGKRYDYAVKCFQCHRLQPYVFFAEMRAPATGHPVIGQGGKPIRAGVVWDRTARTKEGLWNITRAAETTRFKCCYCGFEHLDEMRTYEKFAASSDYVCHDPDRSIVDVSLRWNALVGGDWWRLTRKFLQACEVRDLSGATEGLADFYRKQLALFWDPSLGEQKITLATLDQVFMEPVRAKDYKAEPLEWEAGRFITADYQQGSGGDTRHLLVVARAWADRAGNRSRLLWWGRCNTFSELYAVQTALKVPSECVCVDGSFEMMEVAAQCAKYNWTMLIGDDKDWFPHKRKKGPAVRRPYSEHFWTDPRKGKTGQGKSKAYSMFWSNPSIKNLLWNLRSGLTRHKWELPADIPPDYRDGIDSEVKKYVPKKGSAVPVPEWVKIKAYNHPWDDECMQVVCAVAAGYLTFDVEEERPPGPAAAADAPPAKDEPVAPHQKPDQLELLQV